MRASHMVGIILIVAGTVGVVASVGGYGIGAILPWLVAVTLIGIGFAAILGAVSGRPAGASPAIPPVAPASPGFSPEAVAPGTPPGPGAPLAPGAPAASAPVAPATYHKSLGDIEMVGPMILGPSRFETFMGEIKLDLTRAVIPDGETAISANTVVGEVRVLVPADVGVAARVGTLLGSAEVLGRKGGSLVTDEMAVSEDYATATRRLRIEARTVLGDVAVRRARPAGWEPPAAPASMQPPAPASGALTVDAPPAIEPPAAIPPAAAPPAEAGAAGPPPP